ncbi:hypothetical protein HPB48_020613 [Haemaphysalis longicornis]|uniref:Uncharacterized protein n=1 Tax=Haemaphysalis longicornis TaxID=44386 RepID=A0A9J6GK85_HAELO|nr:hypothetical protein HPB48_020613 [Haemaphysalis longicornis]
MADTTEMCTTRSTTAGQFHQPAANPTAALTKEMGASLCASASTVNKKLSLKDGVKAALTDSTDNSVDKLTEDPREPLDRRAWIDRRISRGELVLTIPPSSASPVLVAVEASIEF